MSTSGILTPAAFAAVLLSACSPPTVATTASSRDAPFGGASTQPHPCPAALRQGWVGQSVEVLPAQPETESWRVVCTTCARTEDHRLVRMTIEFDEVTQRIVSVACG